jgi:hypothetical protein
MPPRSENGQWLLAPVAADLVAPGLECAAMQRRSLSCAFGAALISLAACQTNDPPATASAPAPVPVEVARAPHHKPSAPVALRFETRPAGGRDYDVTMIATPSAAVGSLELVLDGRTVMVGATAAGQARTVTARIDAGAQFGKDIVGSAAVDVGRHRRRAAAVTRIGVPALFTPTPIHIVRLADGTEVAEVRP